MPARKRTAARIPPRGDARESGLGEAIAHDDLQQCPGEAQHAAHQEPESRARQPQLPDDRQVRGVRRPVQQGEDDAVRRYPDGAQSQMEDEEHGSRNGREQREGRK